MKKVIALCAFALGVSLIILSVLLIRHTCEKGERMDRKKEPKMECTLTLATTKAKVGDDPDAEVAIKNLSDENLVIDYIANPINNLDLQVFDPAGKKISRPYCIFCSITDKGQLTLRPGETYRLTLGIFATLDKGGPWRRPGTYKITAIYEYNNDKAVSKQLELTLTPK